MPADGPFSGSQSACRKPFNPLVIEWIQRECSVLPVEARIRDLIRGASGIRSISHFLATCYLGGG